MGENPLGFRSRVRMVFRKGAETAVTETPGEVESGAVEDATPPAGTEAERVLAHGS